MPTRSQAAVSLVSGGKTSDVIAFSVWTTGDVIDKAENMGFKVKKSEAECVLENIHGDQTASQGINWDVIEWAIREYMEGK